MTTVLITKANGEQEPFNETKLDRSLERAGASKEMREKIIHITMSDLRDGMSTQEIYERAFDMLRDEERRPVAARYSIKRAVLDLGPSGFPFEQFMGAIFEAIGYTDVQTGVALQGKCAPHEVDIVAEHEGKRVAAEVKFHNSLGVKTDLKVALYVKARFDDLSAKGEKVDEGWLITNTRFTRNAARYSNCVGMHLLGWDYPRGRGLEILVDQSGIHPITALTSLSPKEKRSLLDDNIVLCRQMPRTSEELSVYGIPKDKHDAIREEVGGLCAVPKANV